MSHHGERVGQQVGNYRLEQLLGSGGFADVYLSKQVFLESPAALKLLHTNLAQGDIEGFRSEAITLVRLIHPHIVRILDFGVEGTTPFLVMDYAPHGTLRQRHRRGEQLPLTLVVDYVKQIASALQYAHDQNIIHRDIQPENMLLGRQHEVLLSDFGIAVVAQTSHAGLLYDRTGTITYMAPEQIQRQPRKASDQYALGAVVYEWLTSYPPFTGSFTEIVAGHLLGALFPKVESMVFPISALPTLQTLGDIGLVLYMFSLGARIDTLIMLRQSRKAIVVSLSGIVLLLTMGATLAFFLYPGLAGSKANLESFMLLVGTALAITAFPVLARLLTERNIPGTQIGMLALTCAAVDDLVAWCLLALVIAIIHAQGLASIVVTVGLTVLFIGVMLGAIRPSLLFVDRRIQSKPLLLALSMILLLLSAYATNAIGIHPVFGAFMMGIILPRRTMFLEQIRNIDQTNSLLFLPSTSSTMDYARGLGSLVHRHYGLSACLCLL